MYLTYFYKRSRHDDDYRHTHESSRDHTILEIMVLLLTNLLQATRERRVLLLRRRLNRSGIRVNVT